MISRLFASIVAGVYMLKLWDLGVDAIRGRQVDGPATMRFLANPVSLVRRCEGRERQPGLEGNVREMLHAIVGALLATIALLLSRLVPWSEFPFLVEHGVKAIGCFLLGVAGFHVIAPAARLLGGYAIDPGTAPRAASTPADFWRRYNRAAGQFLNEDVFQQVRGLRHPVRGTLMAFAVSGLLHEYMFSVSAGRFQGLQLAFFLIQGLGVALTLRIRPHGWSLRAWQAATFLFNLLTSLLFFASGQEIVRIYSDPPGWMP